MVDPYGGKLNRRDALRQGAGSAAWLSLGALGLPFTARAGPGKAKAVIQIWLWGGPSHIDSFDPKPDAGNEYMGQLPGVVETNVKGIRLGELLPLLAKQADKYALIRSMTHGVNAHETASYVVQTGRPAGGRDVYPSAGAVVSLFKGYNAGYRGLIPPYVVLTQPQGRFSESGFLGSRYKPFATGGDPAQARFAVEGIVAQSVTEQRQRNRRDYLAKMDTLAQALPGDAQLAASQEATGQAYELILGDAGKVFDLGQEKDDMRERYGRNTFGQSCLVARRLVERGVPFITINFQGWDTHKQHFQFMRQRVPQLDRGLSALLEDLDARGLLASTIVWCSGEFGRTPRVQWEPPWNGGRNHYGKVFSALVAGGGFRGGQVVGSSDARAEEVRDRPVYPLDLIGAMYELLGIDGTAKLPHPLGEMATVLPAAGEKVESGGRLKELL